MFNLNAQLAGLAVLATLAPVLASTANVCKLDSHQEWEKIGDDWVEVVPLKIFWRLDRADGDSNLGDSKDPSTTKEVVKEAKDDFVSRGLCTMAPAASCVLEQDHNNQSKWYITLGNDTKTTIFYGAKEQALATWDFLVAEDICKKPL